MVAALRKVGIARARHGGRGGRSAAHRPPRQPSLPRAAGRPVDACVAVTARSHAQEARHRSARRRAGSTIRWRWRSDPGIDVLRRADGRRRRAGAGARSRPRSTAGKSVVTANKALLAKHGVALARAGREARASRSTSRRRSAGGIPIIKTLREGARRQQHHARLRHPQRHLQLHPDADGAGGAVLRGLPRRTRSGSAMPRPIRPSTSRATTPRRSSRSSRASPSARRSTPSAIYVEGISSITPADLEAADELGYRVKLLGVAVRTETGIEQRVHPTMVPKSSAIAQVMGVTNAVTIDADARPPITLVGPGAGGDRDGLRGGGRHRRCRARRARGRRSAAPAEQLDAPASGRRCSAMRAATTSASLARDQPGAAATIATRLAEQKISLEIDRAAPSAAGATRDPAARTAAPVPVILITYATTEDAVREALAAVAARQGDIAARRR